MIARRLSLLLFFLASPLAAAELVLQAPDEIGELLAPWLPEEAGNPRQLQGVLGEILATEGYFSPAFEFAEQDGGLKLTLDPGPRTSIVAVDMAIDGPLDASTRSAQCLPQRRTPPAPVAWQIQFHWSHGLGHASGWTAGSF